MLQVNSKLLPTVAKFFEDDWNNVFDWKDRNFAQRNSTHPAVNIEDVNDHILINLAAPGMKKEDFKVELNNNILSITGEAKLQDTEKEGENYLLQEFNYSRFYRRFNLNNSILDNQKVEAAYKNGILTIRLTKKEEVKSTKQIVVK